ncbi:hypothetical protein G4B88_009538 [Cannabis sativa]|uniref:Uncharacterized protein n=1 Tax=Cannabis sativa TaxID=3483 RepID=A0A7J6DTY7_CANSA|nr:hypothetical protein G4B88_009538 [Cannabis sativa]
MNQMWSLETDSRCFRRYFSTTYNHKLHQRNSGGASSKALQLRKRPVLSNRETPPDSSYTTTARRKKTRQSQDVSEAGQEEAIELECQCSCSKWSLRERRDSCDDCKERDGDVQDKRSNEKAKLSKPETKRALFYKSSDDKGHRFGGSRSGSRVAPFQEDSNDSTVVVSNATADIHKNHNESEDLTLIRHQLVQIEKQQSSLSDLLQVHRELTK